MSATRTRPGRGPTWRAQAGRRAARHGAREGRADRARLPRWSLRDALRDCNLANVEAPYSEWRAVELHGCRLTGLDLRDSSGRHVLFADCRADLVSLRSARLEGAVFRDCLLTGADFSGADLRGARFERCDLTEVELREARLEGAVLDGCRLDGRARRPGAARDEDALGRRRRARAGLRRRAGDRADRVRLLVIGGTVFLGRAVVADALARGHAVTIFHRGLHNPDLFPEAEHLLGDRTRDLSALHGREWDAVIDTCGFEPEHVGAARELLADRRRPLRLRLLRVGLSRLGRTRS